MKRILLALTVLAWPALFALSAYAQYTAEEIAQRPQGEEFLKTAEIIRSEEVGEGVTKPIRLYLKKGDIEASAAWKNASGVQQGFFEGWQYEIAAYQLDKLVGLNAVPPAVEREFKGKKGALSLWATSEYSLLRIMEEKIEIPAKALRQGGLRRAAFLEHIFIEKGGIHEKNT